MDDLREAAEMALEWIEAQPEPRMIGAQACIEALRKALTEDSTVEREWVGLTWDEMSQIIEDFYTPALLSQLCRAIEAKLKEKNA